MKKILHPALFLRYFDRPTAELGLDLEDQQIGFKCYYDYVEHDDWLYSYKILLENILDLIRAGRREGLFGIKLEGLDLSSYVFNGVLMSKHLDSRPYNARIEHCNVNQERFFPNSHFRAVTCLTSLGQYYLISGSNDGYIRFWDTRYRNCLISKFTARQKIEAIRCFSNQIVYANESGLYSMEVTYDNSPFVKRSNAARSNNKDEYNSVLGHVTPGKTSALLKNAGLFGKIIHLTTFSKVVENVVEKEDLEENIEQGSPLRQEKDSAGTDVISDTARQETGADSDSGKTFFYLRGLSRGHGPGRLSAELHATGSSGIFQRKRVRQIPGERK